MKVNETSLNQAAASQLGRARQAETLPPEGPKPGAGPQAAEPDRVQLSELSGRLLKILMAESPERAARLERLGAEFRAGTHPVDALAVSRGLIDEALEG